MRRGGWATVGMLVGAVASLSMFRPSGTGVRAVLVIIAGMIPGGLVGGGAAMLGRRRAERAFRAELEGLGFSITFDLGLHREPAFLRWIGLAFWVVAERDVQAKPVVVAELSNLGERSRMEFAVSVMTMAPSSWPDFEIAPHDSVMMRKLPTLAKEFDGAFGPEFDARFKVRSGSVDALRGALAEGVQRQLLLLPKRTTISCREGELRLERKLADPGDFRRLVAVCDALGDLRRPRPPTAEELAALESLD